MVAVRGKIIHFGAKGYGDYTTHKDESRKQNYLRRHAREDWTDVNTAGFWARWLLWNKRTLAESIADVSRRFNLRIKTRMFSLDR